MMIMIGFPSPLRVGLAPRARPRARPLPRASRSLRGGCACRAIACRAESCCALMWCQDM